jgi:hypothetical protein
MEVIERITLEEIERSRPEKIYYGATTCWWTHDPKHLSLTPEPTEGDIRRLAETMLRSSGRDQSKLGEYLEIARRQSFRLPCDPRGGMLFETDNVSGFLAAARRNPESYGRHGLRAFVAAHHLNSVLSLEGQRPWCEREWDAYNDALDRLDARGAQGGGE